MHVVIVSFGYPPIRHVSGTRAAFMGAHLCELGHEVTVVTVDWRDDAAARPRQTVERGVNVIRIDPRQWYPGFDPAGPPFMTEPPLPAFRQRARTLKATVVWGPYAGWARHALAELLVVNAERPIDVAWAIHGDDSSHEVAMRLHLATRVPWVADFKDPWNVFHARALWPLQWLVTWRRLRTAVSVTEASEAQGEIDAMFAKPWRTVWSGYDAQSMQDAVPVRSSSRFTLAYVGNASTQHDVAAFARTLAAWLGNKGEPECEFHYFGYESPTLIQALRAAGVSHILQQHEFIPREEAFARMKGADVLVLMPLSIHGRSRIAVGVKELEYLASGTPVLVIGRLLPELRRHFGDTPQVMEAADSEAGVNFLRQEYDAFRAGRSSNRRRPPNDEVALSFSWTAQVRVLADVLSRAAEKRPRNAAR